MPKALILYATREGQTEKVARRIAEHLKQAGLIVKLLNAQGLTSDTTPDLNQFDLLVFGASMHAGGLEKELTRFINVRVDQINAKRRSFFLVLLSAAARDQSLREAWLADARQKLSQKLRVGFDDIEMIAGALTYSKYSKPLKWVMQRIARKAGGDSDISRDYEYTDWAQVECYAQRLASAYQTSTPDNWR